MAILEVRGVVKRFGGLTAVKNVSFELQQGEILGLIGPNGAGKTTLFNCIAGVYPLESGEILFKGQNIAGLPPNKICHLGIARTFQVVKPFETISVFDNVVVGGFCRAKSRAEAELAAREALEITRFGSRAVMQAQNLTVAGLKRLELARALATRPELLLLDEVVAGCNPKESDELVEIIRDVRERGVTILIIEHVMKALMALSDRVVVLHNGELIANGTPAQIALDENVVKAYLGDDYGSA
ncbi:MAG: ABC transporter ATP-binding protein [Chloroflexota bacterium]